MSFYAYLHCTPEGVPFYVGKGRGRRAYDFKHRNAHHRSVIRRHGASAIRVILIPAADEAEAFRLEVTGIALLRHLGYRLVNQTEGGEGSSGSTKSAETRWLISTATIATMATAEFKRKRSAISKRIHTDEVKLLKSRLATDQWADPSIREARIQRMRGYRWITDGVTSAKLWQGQRMPSGFWFGRPEGITQPKR